MDDQEPMVDGWPLWSGLPKPAPVGCIKEVHTKTSYGGTVAVVPHMYRFLPVGTLLYAAPPKKEWVGLTDEDKRKVCEMTERDDRGYVMAIVEAMLKDKNP